MTSHDIVGDHFADRAGISSSLHHKTDTDTDTDNSLFDNSTTKSNNQCSTFRINTNSFNVERHGDHIKTYIHVDFT